MSVAIVEETLGGEPADKESALAPYRRRTEEVRAAIAPERLLIFDVAMRGTDVGTRVRATQSIPGRAALFASSCGEKGG